MEFEFKMTLIANGVASGPARVIVTTQAHTFARFLPSGHGLFKSSAHEWGVQVLNAQFINDFVHGYMTIVDSNNWPAMSHVPFCAYVGPEWPQAPLGIVHGLRPVTYDEQEFWLFSVLIEKP